MCVLIRYIFPFERNNVVNTPECAANPRLLHSERGTTAKHDTLFELDNHRQHATKARESGDERYCGRVYPSSLSIVRAPKHLLHIDGIPVRQKYREAPNQGRQRHKNY